MLSFCDIDLPMAISDEVAVASVVVAEEEKYKYSCLPDEDSETETSNGCHGLHTVHKGKNHCSLKKHYMVTVMASHDDRSVTALVVDEWGVVML